MKTKSVTILISILCLWSVAVLAGPKDIGTKYPVKVKISGLDVGSIVDSGGTTSLSFEDAKKAGLLNADGNPTRTPAGSGSLGGTGGGSVKVHIFDNVTITVTPLKGDRTTTNGESRNVKVSVVVPQKASSQSGSYTTEKQNKVDSLITKLGANVVGATTGGGHLAFADNATTNPRKNTRSTSWTNPPPPAKPKKPAGIKIPLNIIPTPPNIRLAMNNVGFNNSNFGTYITTLPITLIPESMASTIGIFEVDSFTLDSTSQSVLFTEGYVDTLPGDGLLTLGLGFLDQIVLPTIDGPFIINDVAALINPQSDVLLLGANGLIPSGYSGWEDLDTEMFNLSSNVPEPPTIALILTAFILLAVSKIRRNATFGKPSNIAKNCGLSGFQRREST